MEKLAILAAALALAGCHGGPPSRLYGNQALVEFPAEAYVLPNGMSVVLAPDASTTQAAVNVRYDAGAADDPKDRPGTAHLYEHMMFEGSRHAAKPFAEYLEKCGATAYGGMTLRDRSEYWETVPGSQLETMLWLESDRLAFLDTPDAVRLDRERPVIEMERRLRSEGNVGSLIRERIDAELFPAGHPYHPSAGALAHAYASITPQQLADFGSRYYVPDNASLVIAGNFDPNLARDLVDRYFGALPSRKRPERPTAPLPNIAASRISMTAPDAIAAVVMAWVTPAFGTKQDAELDLIAAMLQTKLWEAVQKDKRLAQYLAVRQASERIASTFWIYAQTERGIDLEVLERALAGALDRFIEDPPMRSWPTGMDIVTRTYFMHEYLSSRASLINIQMMLNGKAQYLQEALVRYGDLNAGGARETIRRVLSPEHRITLAVLPKEGA